MVIGKAENDFRCAIRSRLFHRAERAKKREGGREGGREEQIEGGRERDGWKCRMRECSMNV